MRNMRRRRGLWLAAWLGLLGSAASRAEQFWVDYEGDDYPENQGWTRAYGNENGPYAGGANRSLDDGIFTLDSLHNSQIYDFYRMDRTVDPDPGELFVAEWRVRIDPSSTSRDAGVVITRALSPGYVLFRLGPDSIYIRPGNIVIGLTEGVFHSYRFESADMRYFELDVDGTSTFNGYLEDVATLQYYVSFGDGVQGQRSLSEWDYLRYGIVPEPSVVEGLLCLLASSWLRPPLRQGTSA